MMLLQEGTSRNIQLLTKLKVQLSFSSFKCRLSSERVFRGRLTAAAGNMEGAELSFPHACHSKTSFGVKVATPTASLSTAG